jgi:hypothetical protein
MSKNRSMRKLFHILALVLFQFPLGAQVKNHLPYSLFGIGEINPKGFSRNFAMGRSGIGLASGYYLNNINPASYHEMDSISFFFDFGLAGDFTKYATQNNTQKGHDINMRNLALGFRINRNWSASFGVTPYSTVAYQITSVNNVEGTTDQFTANMKGSGGLTQFYWDNSYVLFKHLSLGINTTYLFGNIESDEEVQYDKFQYKILSNQSSRLNKVYFDFGFQYFFRTGKDYNFNVGGIFGNSHKLNFKESILISQSDGLVFEDKVTRTGTFDLPLYYGAGFSMEWDNKLTISGDYLYHDWSSVTSENTQFKFVSNHTFRLGAEYIPGRLNQLGYMGRISYRAGYYYEGSYIQVRNTTIADNGLSFGVGIPFLKNKTSINLSYYTGVKGTTDNGLIREKYHSFFLSLTLHDWWFIKPKYD